MFFKLMYSTGQCAEQTDCASNQSHLLFSWNGKAHLIHARAFITFNVYGFMKVMEMQIEGRTQVKEDHCGIN